MLKFTRALFMVFLFSLSNLPAGNLGPGLIKLNDNHFPAGKWFAGLIRVSGDGKFAVYAETGGKNEYAVWLINLDDFAQDTSKRTQIFYTAKFDQVSRNQYQLYISNDGSVVGFEAPDDVMIGGNPSVAPIMHLYFSKSQSTVKLFIKDSLSGNYLFSGGPVILTNDGKSLIFSNNLGWDSYKDGNNVIQFNKNSTGKNVLWKCSVSENLDAIQKSATVFAECNTMLSSYQPSGNGSKVLGVTRFDPTANSLNKLYYFSSGTKSNIFTDNRSYYPGSLDLTYDKHQILISKDGKSAAYILDTVTTPHVDKPFNGYTKIGIFNATGGLTQTFFGPDEKDPNSSLTYTIQPNNIFAMNSDGSKIIVSITSKFSFNEMAWLLDVNKNSYTLLDNPNFQLTNPQLRDACLDSTGDIAGLVLAGQAFVWNMKKGGYVVNSADDKDDGVCNDIHCSLREAINAANADKSPGAKYISFNLPTKDSLTIKPTSALPKIASDIIFDGTRPNQKRIILDGSAVSTASNGLDITSGTVKINSMEIRNFKASGIKSESNDTLFFDKSASNDNQKFGIVAKNYIKINNSQKTSGTSAEVSRNKSGEIYSYNNSVSANYVKVANNSGAGIAAFESAYLKGNFVTDNFGDGIITQSGDVLIYPNDEFSYAIDQWIKNNHGCGIWSAGIVNAYSAFECSGNSSFGISADGTIFLNNHIILQDSILFPIDIKQTIIEDNGKGNYFFELNKMTPDAVAYDSIAKDNKFIFGGGVLSWKSGIYAGNLSASNNNGFGVLGRKDVFITGGRIQKNRGDGISSWSGAVELSRWMKDSTAYFLIQDNLGSGISTCPHGGGTPVQKQIFSTSAMKITGNSQWGIRSFGSMQVNTHRTYSFYHNPYDFRNSTVSNNGKGNTVFDITAYDAANHRIDGLLSTKPDSLPIGGGLWAMNNSASLANTVITDNFGPGIASYLGVLGLGVKVINNEGPGIWTSQGDVTLWYWFPDTTQNEISGNKGVGVYSGKGFSGENGFRCRTSVNIQNNAYLGAIAYTGIDINTIDGSLGTWDKRTSNITGNGIGDYYWVVDDWNQGDNELVCKKIKKSSPKTLVYGGGLWSVRGRTAVFGTSIISDNNGPGIAAGNGIYIRDGKVLNNNGPGLYAQKGTVDLNFGCERLKNFLEVSGNKGDGIYAGGVNGSIKSHYRAIKAENNAGWGLNSMGTVYVNDFEGLTTGDNRESVISNNGNADSVIIMHEWSANWDGMEWSKMKRSLSSANGGIFSAKSSVLANIINVSGNGGPGIAAFSDIYLTNCKVLNNNGPGVYSFLGQVKFLANIVKDDFNEISGNNGVGIFANGNKNYGISSEAALKVETNASFGLFSNKDIFLNLNDQNGSSTKDLRESVINNNCNKDGFYEITDWSKSTPAVITMSKISSWPANEKCGILDSGRFFSNHISLTNNGGDGLKVKKNAFISNFKIAGNSKNGLVIGEFGELMNGIVFANGDAGIKANYLKNIQNVTVANNKSQGIVLGLYPFNNLAKKQGGDDIQTAESSTMSNSSITGNGADGLSVDAKNDKDVKINNCQITNNLGFGVQNFGTIVVDATKNWWGSNSGPSGEGTGTGDRVSKRVLFDNFLKTGIGLIVNFPSDTLTFNDTTGAIILLFAINHNFSSDSITIEFSDDLGWLNPPKSVSVFQPDSSGIAYNVSVSLPISTKNDLQNMLRVKATSKANNSLISADSVRLISYKPVISSIEVVPDSVVLWQNEQIEYHAISRDQKHFSIFSNPVAWSCAGGKFDSVSTSLFQAGSKAGTFDVVAFDSISGITGKCKVIISDSVLGVKELPNDFVFDAKNSLSAFPNPFDSRVKIIYKLESPAFVRIKIFDILGREVAEIANDEFNSGVFGIEWQPENLPAGTYLYQILVNQKSETGIIVYR